MVDLPRMSPVKYAADLVTMACGRRREPAGGARATGKHLAGAWLGVYVVRAVLALYLNVFVLLAQLFLRLPALIVVAPTQKEPPFLVTQLVVLVVFLWLGRAAVKGFRAESAAPA
jgi:hypothetical protein